METKVAAITGAYSGLGASLSRLLAKKGYKLVLGGRNKDKLEKFTDEIKKITDATSVIMDVRKKNDCKRFIKNALDSFGRLDLLINNAGVWKFAKIEDATEKDIKEVFETNVFGPMFCSQAAVEIMKKQKAGHILNIGSTAAVDFKSSFIAYGSSKAALVSFTGCLRAEFEGTGIRVSAFSPGGTKTNLFRSEPEKDIHDYMEPDFVAEKILEHIENPTDEWHIILRRPKK